MRQDYNESAIKDRSVAMVIKLIQRSHPMTAAVLDNNFSILRDMMVRNIQKIGVHEYASRLLKPRSDEQRQLNEAIEEARSHAKTSSNL